MRACVVALFLLTSTVLPIAVSAQAHQVVRGQVVDRESQQPLPGANVVVEDSDPLMGATTDAEGASEEVVERLLEARRVPHHRRHAP